MEQPMTRGQVWPARKLRRGEFAAANRPARTLRRGEYAAANRPARINASALLLGALAIPALYFLAVLVATVIGEFTRAR
ncbi:MAG: hypothetical protein ACT4PP_02675 [Sporichthyaceae bacterium]